METVAVLLMLLVAVAYALRVSYLPRAGVAAATLLPALVAALSCDYAASQSKTQIADWLANPALMLDIAVVLTIDVMVTGAFCLAMASVLASEKISRRSRVILRILSWWPGLMIFPTVVALTVEVIFASPGKDFATVARCVGIGVAIAVPLLVYGLRWLMNDAQSRLELTFLVNAIIGALGIVATVNGRTAAIGTDATEWLALATFIALAAVAAIVGIIIYRKQTSKKISRIP